MNPREIIRRPILTEKSLRGGEAGKYTFEVALRATKFEVRAAVEAIFSVRVRKVNVINIPGRVRRRGRYTFQAPMRRKAIVTLAPGGKIDLEALT
jgi:large subunit ribosomal protein L23